MYCSNCGVQLNDGANFCEKCGAKNYASNSQADFESENPNSDIDAGPVKTPTSFSSSNSNTSYNNLEFNTGAKVWLSICMVANGIVAAVNAYNFLDKFSFRFDERMRYHLEHYSSTQMEVLLIIFSIVMCNCFGQMLKNRTRLPFYTTIGIGVFTFFYNIYLGLGVWSVLGLSGFVITYLLIRKNWPYMPLK